MESVHLHLDAESAEVWIEAKLRLTLALFSLFLRINRCFATSSFFFMQKKLLKVLLMALETTSAHIVPFVPDHWRTLDITFAANLFFLNFNYMAFEALLADSIALFV